MYFKIIIFIYSEFKFFFFVVWMLGFVIFFINKIDFRKKEKNILEIFGGKDNYFFYDLIIFYLLFLYLKFDVRIFIFVENILNIINYFGSLRSK